MTELFPDISARSAPVERRTCTSCKGSGKAYKWDFETEARPCFGCRGAGYFEPPDTASILAAIKGRKGLRSARPPREAGPRPYFVWRLARWHGGADVTMPMVAEMEIRGDPFAKELDALAEAVARRVYGTDMAAAHRWGHALGYLQAGQEMPGLPSTAYSSGPVIGFGATKPEGERLELDAPEEEEQEAEELADTRRRAILDRE